MKTETFKGEISSAYGNPVSPAIKFEGSFESFENKQEVEAARELPTDAEIVDWANNRRKASERQKSMQAALDAAGIKKPTLEDPAVQYREMVKVLRASGKSEDEAAQIARTVLGYTG